MSNYQPDWDLSTIPDDIFASERARRHRAKAPAITYQKLKSCKGCGRKLNSTQRRKPCPKCGHVHPRK